MYECLLGCLVAGILSHSGDHRAHSARSGKQSEIVWSRPPQGLHSVSEVQRRAVVRKRGDRSDLL